MICNAIATGIFVNCGDRVFVFRDSRRNAANASVAQSQASGRYVGAKDGCSALGHFDSRTIEWIFFAVAVFYNTRLR